MRRTGSFPGPGGVRGPCWYTGIVSRPVLVVDNFDSFVYNLVQYLGQLGVRCIVRRNDAGAGHVQVYTAQPSLGAGVLQHQWVIVGRQRELRDGA